MRYTTIIDITRHVLYRNQHARLLYLHMALTAGYHDEDRDLVTLSIRTLAWQVGLSVGATRHALQQLEKAGLIKKQGRSWTVTKFVHEPAISKRKQVKKSEVLQQTRNENQERLDQELERQHRQHEKYAKQGKTAFMVAYERQSAKAAAGDLDAKEYCERNRKVYESHKQQMEQEQ